MLNKIFKTPLNLSIIDIKLFKNVDISLKIIGFHNKALLFLGPYAFKNLFVNQNL